MDMRVVDLVVASLRYSRSDPVFGVYFTHQLRHVSGTLPVWEIFMRGFLLNSEFRSGVSAVCTFEQLLTRIIRNAEDWT